MSVSFSFALVLIPYLLLLAGLGILAAFAIYHLLHYGATARVSLGATVIFIAGALVLIGVTATLLQGTDWKQPVIIAPSLPSLSAPAPKP